MDILGFEDKTSLDDGEWVKDFPFLGLDGVEFHIRSANYKPYTRARDALYRAAALSDDPAKQDAIMTVIAAPAIADHLLINWKGITLGGKEAKFSPDLATKLLTAEDSHGVGDRFRMAVTWASDKVASDLLAKVGEVAKN